MANLFEKLRKKKEIKTERITIRMTVTQREMLEQKAKERNMDLSKYINTLLFDRIYESPELMSQYRFICKRLADIREHETGQYELTPELERIVNTTVFHFAERGMLS